MDPVIARRLVLPLIHRLRGEPVAARTRFLRESAAWSRERLEEYRLLRLRRLVDVAFETVPFHRRRLEAVGYRPGDLRDLSDLARLPLLEKRDVAALAAGIRTPGTLPGRITPRRTAGSSGTPLTVLADAETSAWSFAARNRFQGWFGLEPGAPQARFWGRPLQGSLRKARLKDALLNRVTVDSRALDPGRAAGTLERLRRFRPAYAYGYTSMLLAFADVIEASGPGGDALGLRAAIYTSESCLPTQARRLELVLGCPVTPEYGCSEVDIIAFGCPRGGLHVNAESICVEIIPCDEAPAGAGEVVITDLNNTLMPMLRYRLGDLARHGAGSCPCGSTLPLLAEVTGRSQGQFFLTRRGTRIHSQTLAYLFEEWAADGWPLHQFQMIQEALGHLRIELAVTPGGALDLEAATARIRAEVEEILEEPCRIDVEVVDAVDAGRGGRKFRHFVSRLDDPPTTAGGAPS